MSSAGLGKPGAVPAGSCKSEYPQELQQYKKHCRAQHRVPCRDHILVLLVVLLASMSSRLIKAYDHCSKASVAVGCSICHSFTFGRSKPWSCTLGGRLGSKLSPIASFVWSNGTEVGASRI